jgi:aldose 1-epimerase
MTRPEPGGPPTGRQLILRSGAAEAVVCEVGATIRRWRVGDHEVLMGFDGDRFATGGRQQVLAPWPNRVEDGSYRFDGALHQLPIDEPDRHCAIHGLVRWSRFDVLEHQDALARLGAWCPPRPGWPFSLWLEVAATLDEGSLCVEADAENVGTTALPFGIGFHPYFCVAERADDASLRLGASARLSLDERGLPRGVAELEGKWRSGAEAIGADVLDDCAGPLDHDASGVARAELTGPQGTVQLEVGPTLRWLQVFTADTLAEPDRRRAVAIEPMSCPPNALRTGTDLVRLEPGERWQGWWRATFLPPASSR